MTAARAYTFPRRTCPRCALTLPDYRFHSLEAVLCRGCAGRSPSETPLVVNRTIARRYALTDKARAFLARERAGLA